MSGSDDPLTGTAFQTLQDKVGARLRGLALGITAILLMFYLGLAWLGVTVGTFYFIVCAVFVPADPPPSSMIVLELVSIANGVMNFLETKTRMVEAQTYENSRNVHCMRALVPLYCGIASMILAWRFHRYGPGTFWGDVRIMSCSTCALRIGVNSCIFLLLDTEAWGHLPGDMSYMNALAYNLAYIAVFAFVLSPSNRLRLSEIMGQRKVVCSLAELPSPHAARTGRCVGLGGEMERAKECLCSVDSDSAAPEMEQPAAPTGARRRRSTSRSRARESPPMRRGASPSGGSSSIRDSRVREPSHDARGRARSARSSAVSSAASELEHALDGIDPDCVQYKSYQLLPQFYHDTADYLDSILRRRLQLRVRDGRLVDDSGALLAPDGEQNGMYVMSPAGEVYTSFGLQSIDARNTYKDLRHSSLVAGSPVAAAGMLTVAHGRLIRLTNESGHYAPPPSSLTCMIDRLASLGVRRLDEVHLEIFRRLEYEPPTPVSEHRRAGRAIRSE